MDAIIKGISLGQEIRFTFADVTESARELCRRHENGRASAYILGEALAACALLSADSDSPGESVQMHLECDGQLGGFQVEVTGTGKARGYTKRKRLGELDNEAVLANEKVLGRNGALTVIVSTPSKVIYSGQVAANPPEVRSATARYCNQSLQIPSGVEILAVMGADNLERAVALVAQKMPSGDTDAFVQVLEAFHEGKVKEMLAGRKGGEPLWDVFGLADVETTDSRPLAFGCRCSEEAVLRSLGALATEEISEIIDETGSQEVTCHMCGEIYVVQEDALLQILIDRAKGGPAAT